MSSKRSKRKKRKEAFKNYDPVAALPNEPKKETKKKEINEVIVVPGQRQLRIGGALLLLGGVLSAGIVYYALNKLNGMSADEVIALTSLNGDTPLSYMTTIALTSVLAIFQFLFGYPIFKHARDPFYAKRALFMGITMLALELTVNIIGAAGRTTGFNVLELSYGCIIPLIIIYGAYKEYKYAKAHPEYIPPAPTQMF